MRNPTTDILTAAADAKDAGVPMKQILADTGLNYSQVWDFWARRYLENQRQDLIVDTTEMSEAQIGQAIAKMRKVGGEFASWGWIMARTNLREGRVRKLFEQHTNLRSDGLRIGRGGRFIQDDGMYYLEQNRTTGVVTPKGEQHNYPTNEEIEFRLAVQGANLKTLRGMAKELDVKGATTMTKADLVNALFAAGARANA